MTFEVPESKSIDIEALKKQINDLFNVIVARPSVLKSSENSVHEVRTHKVTRPVVEHSAWVQSMAKFRKLEPINDKLAMLESLDERFK